MKLRAHYHFIVKQQLQRTLPPYNVHAIRAVLIETADAQWAHNLREAAQENLVSNSPSPNVLVHHQRSLYQTRGQWRSHRAPVPGAARDHF